MQLFEFIDVNIFLKILVKLNKFGLEQNKVYYNLKLALGV
jgi:hypothetical protein